VPGENITVTLPSVTMCNIGISSPGKFFF